jgi:hypothetical protein
MTRPYFLITIDTEGDNAWARPRVTATRNADFIPRFQELCERFGLRPTYLTTYEMACCPRYRAFARSVLALGRAEIGMHLHAWDTPPLLPLTSDDRRFQPYLIEYAEPAMAAKIRVTTRALEDAFAVPIRSHRAGRWSFDARYARVLAKEGYWVDCSVTPLVSWQGRRGAPWGRGGTDYRRYPDAAYFVNPNDTSRPGGSPLLEVPVTILPGKTDLPGRTASRLRDMSAPFRAVSTPIHRVCHRLSPPARWLRPNGRNRKQLLEVVDEVAASGRDYAEFMLHSSELMPGGSPTFRNRRDIERLYAHLEELFSAVRDRYIGATLTEYYRAYLARESHAPAASDA